MASLPAVVQEIDSLFKEGYAAANPNLVGLIVLADAVHTLANRLMIEGPMGGDTNVIQNIADAMQDLKSAVNEIASSIYQLDLSGLTVHLDGEVKVESDDV